MKNFRRLALVAGVAALSAVAFSPKAQAQTANVDFEGAIGPACIINSVTNGILGPVNSGTLAAGIGAGTPGKINVTCTNGTTFTITSINNNGSVLTNGTYNTGVSLVTAQIEDGPNFVVSAEVSPDGAFSMQNIGVAGPIQNGVIDGKDYELKLNLFRTLVPLSSGFYKVRVGVALTPQ